jgi:hypothetical protein
MLERPRPRFVEVRRLADGLVAFYFCIPKYYRSSDARSPTSHWAPAMKLPAAKTARVDGRPPPNAEIAGAAFSSRAP